MRWGKALNILIILLVLLNAFMLGMNYQKEIRTYQLSPKRMGWIVDLLNANGVKLKADLPESFTPKDIIWLEPREYTSIQRDALVKNVLGEEGVTITIENSAQIYEQGSRIYSHNAKTLAFKGSTVIYQNSGIAKKAPTKKKQEFLRIGEEFIANIDLFSRFQRPQMEYIDTEYGAKIKYYTVYKNQPIFDSYVELHIADEGVLYACIHELSVVEEDKQKRPIYPVDEVLMGLLDTFQEFCIESITHIEIGYAMEEEWGLHILKEEAIPVYKILVEGLDEALFVNAYTNKKLIKKN
jgi:hypothetical protein